MARSPLTLAATVTSALPAAEVVRVSELSEGASGHFDAALAELGDGRFVVVRVPNDEAAAVELAAETRALGALTAGVRSLLPFRAPELLGEAAVSGARVAVVDYLPGYRVEPAHVPEGAGLATSLGGAIAAVHSLPVSIVREVGLPVRTTHQVRAEVERVLDRAHATDRAPVSLLARWRRALAAEHLWRFEPTVILSGVSASAFLVEDLADVPTVTGLLSWHGLSVGDPATDLQWLASAPAAAEDVFAAYLQHSGRASDSTIRARGRLYAELEFAKWLVHGHDTGSEEVMSDAQSLLDALAASTAGDEIVPDAGGNVDDAIALLDRLPAAPPAATIDTSMQTDAYDADELAQWISEDPDVEQSTSESDAPAPARAAAASHDPNATEPLDVSELREVLGDSEHATEAERASDAALRRWLSD
jgi:macrolide phosphotransferase